MVCPAPLERRVFEFIRAHDLMQPGDHVLIAVSGGPDSVALLDLLVSLRSAMGLGVITVLHLDHRLRGESAREDARHVERLAARYGLPIRMASADVAGLRRRAGVSLEMAARECRQQFFREALDDLGAQRLALGHSADDQAEEVLLRLIRGTGPSGLTGMKPGTGQALVRPLLCATRGEILAHVQARQLPYRLDASNDSPFCQRNVLRLLVFPVLKEHFHPRVVEKLARHAELARDEERCWHDLVKAHWPEVCLHEGAEGVALASPCLRALPAALERRLLRHAIQRLKGDLSGIYSVHVESLRRLLGAARGAMDLPGGVRAVHAAGSLRLTRRPATSWQAFSEVIPGAGSYSLPCGALVLRLDAVRAGARPFGVPVAEGWERATLDADTLRWPLTLRFWQAGDRFQPLGMQGTKKLQDFFVDARIPREERRRTPLLCDREKICWVCGLRLDERVKVTASTRHVLVIDWQKLC